MHTKMDTIVRVSDPDGVEKERSTEQRLQFLEDELTKVRQNLVEVRQTVVEMRKIVAETSQTVGALVGKRGFGTT